HADTSADWSSHWNTPASTEIDALGRVIARTEHVSPAPLITRSAYDIDGNLMQVIDPLGRVVSSGVYDLLGRPWRRHQLHRGSTRLVLDAAGGEVERRDAKGALTLHVRDAARRPSRRWARDRGDGAPTLREVVVHGDAAIDAATAAAANLLGHPYR